MPASPYPTLVTAVPADRSEQRSERPLPHVPVTAPRATRAVKPVLSFGAWDIGVLGGFAVCTVALSLWIASGTSRTMSPNTGQLVAGRGQAFVAFVLTLAAAAMAARPWLQHRIESPSRRGWRGMTIALIVNALGVGLPALGGVWIEPSLAESMSAHAILTSQVIMLAALLRSVSAPYSTLDRTTVSFDAATVVVGGLLILWYNVHPVPFNGSLDATWSIVLAHLIVIADFVLLLVTSVLWRRSAIATRAQVLMLLAVALTLSSLAHSASVVGLLRDTPSPVYLTALAPLSTLGFAIAGWFRAAIADSVETRSSQRAVRAQMSASIIPYLAVLPGFALMLLETRSKALQPLEGLVVGAVVLTVLAFARHVASTREAVRALTESAARHNEARFRALVQHSSDVITILDDEGAIRYVSPSIATVFGHDPENLLGTHLTALLHPDDVDGAKKFLADLARTNARQTPAMQKVSSKREWRFAHANGDWMTVDNVGTNLLREPVVQGLVLNTRDVTEQSVMRMQYMHQAFHDPLTDLANRSLFLYQVGHALARAGRQGHSVTVLFLDLDNFKNVNDSLGHAAGDRLLVDAARRLSACVRDSDLIARLGGDEFAVLVEDAESEE